MKVKEAICFQEKLLFKFGLKTLFKKNVSFVFYFNILVIETTKFTFSVSKFVLYLRNYMNQNKNFNLPGY